ncbi:cytochrome b/b6 domain-containing protein [Streptomyces sp. NPDC090741]|uniref:cytochrome b/b6 domain-containing protein n=1 Tax=Streptomyces sp. NPDC090741 TaxID=3365967 RepID=UPI0037FD1714
MRPATLVVGALTGLLALSVAARAGALSHFWDFLDYGAGVLSLVSLTSAVLWGLAATDRTVLTSGHRLVAQAAHRGLAVAGLGFLLLHIWVKVAESETGVASAFLPFTDQDQPVLIGLGTLAGYLFVSVAVSGAVRSAFATKGRSAWWRALHIGAYPAWGASLVHGLKAGRPASAWVTVSYALCLLGVAVVLAVRLRARLLAAPVRPVAASAATAQGAPPRPKNPPQRFVRQPAEWAAERLTARLARQSDRRSVGQQPDPATAPAGTAFVPSPRQALEPTTEIIPPYGATPYAPSYGTDPYGTDPYGTDTYDTVVIPSGIGAGPGTDRSGGSFGGMRGRQ